MTYIHFCSYKLATLAGYVTLLLNIQKINNRRREALTKWRSRLGSQATYKALMIVFIKADHRDYAENVSRALMDGENADSTDMAGSGKLPVIRLRSSFSLI